MKKLTYPITVACLLAITGCNASNGRLRPIAGRSIPQSSPRSLDPADNTSADLIKTVGYLDETISDQKSNEDKDNGEDNLNLNDANQAASETDATTTTVLNPVTSETATYTLADIEAMALGSNPSIASAQATTSKASGLRRQVGIRPNPTLGYFGQQIADRNTDQHGVFVEQEFVRGDKLQLNRAVLSQTQRAQQAETETQRYRVLTDVRVRFFEAIAARQEADQTREFANAARRGVQVAQDRQEAEEGTLIETLQAKTLLSEIILAAEQAEIAYQGAWQDLAAIAGLHPTTPAYLVADDMDVPLQSRDWQVSYLEILSQSPELTAARAIVCAKQAILKRQQAQPISNVTAQVGAGYDDATEHGLINLELSAPVSLWNKNSGNISAAYSDYVRATQEVQRIEQSIRSRLARAAQAYDSAIKSVRKHEDEIIPQARQSLELSEEAYEAGELEFLQVLIVRRSFFDSSIRLIQAKGQFAQAASRVDGLLLTGGLASPTDYTDGNGLRAASFGGQ